MILNLKTNLVLNGGFHSLLNIFDLLNIGGAVVSLRTKDPKKTLSDKIPLIAANSFKSNNHPETYTR